MGGVGAGLHGGDRGARLRGAGTGLIRRGVGSRLSFRTVGGPIARLGALGNLRALLPRRGRGRAIERFAGLFGRAILIGRPGRLGRRLAPPISPEPVGPAEAVGEIGGAPARLFRLRRPAKGRAGPKVERGLPLPRPWRPPCIAAGKGQTPCHRYRENGRFLRKSAKQKGLRARLYGPSALGFAPAVLGTTGRSCRPAADLAAGHPPLANPNPPRGTRARPEAPGPSWDKTRFLGRSDK